MVQGFNTLLTRVGDENLFADGNGNLSDHPRRSMANGNCGEVEVEAGPSQDPEVRDQLNRHYAGQVAIDGIVRAEQRGVAA